MTTRTRPSSPKSPSDGPLARRLVALTRRLRDAVRGLRFADPVHTVYNPLDYAVRPHNLYLRRYGGTTKRVLFLGMNPGPYGMAQTGVPFGEVSYVRDWLGIEAPVKRPIVEHPRRPVEGFACGRSEVSGARLWGTIARHYRRPGRFFRHHFIANYCPLVFMEESGRNRTPDKLPAREREPLYAACDAHLQELAALFEPDWVIGIGGFAEARAREALGGTGVEIARVLHPSPANPRANRDWAGIVRAELAALGLCDGPAPR